MRKIIVSILVLATLFVYSAEKTFSNGLIPIQLVREGKQKIETFVELADTFKKRAQGLMHRTFLPKEQGMLFTGQRFGAFWMKNTLIPLDIIFINKNRRVTRIITRAMPCSNEPCPLYVAPKNTWYALEFNAGWAEEKGVRVSDTIDMPALVNGSAVSDNPGRP